jgi:flagellar basal body-associated protein FliL
VKSSFIHEGEEKMKRILFIILAVVVVFLILGIAFTSMITQSSPGVDVASREFGFGGGGAPEVGVAPAMEAPALDPSVANSGDAYNTGTVQTQERLVIENADLAIVVKDPKARMAEINALANEFGGYVVSSNLFQSFTSFGKEVPEASIVIRVPSERLDEALTRIKEDVVDIDYENRSGQDVTNIYVDLQAQLKAKQAAEAKLLEIMDQATRAEDVLAIYLQVQQVQTEIEQLKGQIKYYEESAAMSSISVRLIAEKAQPIEIGPWTRRRSERRHQDLIRFVRICRFDPASCCLTLPALILIAIRCSLSISPTRSIAGFADREL